MANNRMWLTCGSEKILFAKFYTNQGWYTVSSQEALDAFLEKCSDKSMIGNTNFRLQFDFTEDTPSKDA